MSGDHNMNQTDSAWRKRQTALDKKAENARELGLDYNKTIMDMAREAGLHVATDVNWMPVIGLEYLEAFAKLVREDEREQIAQMIEDAPPLVEAVTNDHGGCLMCGFTPKLAAKTIRARGQA